MLATVGCSNNAGPAPTSADPTPATAKPADFDPCTDIPAEVLKSENLSLTRPEDGDSNGIKTHGCGYFMVGGYDVRIVRTTLTLPQIKDKFPDSYREQQFGSRAGAFYGLFADRGSESCVMNLEMKTGSLEFDLANPPTRKKTGHMDSCQLVTDLANKVIPSIPEGA
ncbi:DUF3558 domain-containing protein [Nocardia sp. NPDC058480]|uniref:DUF3558 domain-containing protein n=1 Tax=Nocardia sp. NPDC058480 TaxID=3346522 RepID=UPI00364765EB